MLLFRAPVGSSIKGRMVSQPVSRQREKRVRRLLSPARRRACIEQVRAQLHVSERRACAALGQRRSTQRSGREDEERLTANKMIGRGIPISQSKSPRPI